MKIDLHVHFDYKRSIKDNIDYLSNIPIDGVGLCGFRDIEYINEIKDSLTDKLVIVGQEIFSDSLHIIALGINKIVEHKLSIKDTVSRIHSQGALAIAVHPMLNAMNPYRVFKSLGQNGFDAIESFNGLFGPFIIPNFLAKIISKITDIPGISASDAHSLEYIGSSYIEVPCDNHKNISQIFYLIKNGAFTTKNKSYVDIGHYQKTILGIKCAICNKKIVFKKENSQMNCSICHKVESSNIVCRNSHYVCDRCLLGRG